MDHQRQDVRISLSHIQLKLTQSSDGKTPGEVVKQILQIHAILPGQRPDTQFNIPSRTSSISHPNTHETTQPIQQVPTEQSALPSEHVQPVQSQPTSIQSEPAVTAQQQQQSVGPPSNFDGTSAHAPIPIHSSNPADPDNPQPLPLEKPAPQPDTMPLEAQPKFADELPPSKLLNSNPAKFASREDLLRRVDSETLESEEFHDAQS